MAGGFAGVSQCGSRFVTARTLSRYTRCPPYGEIRDDTNDECFPQIQLLAQIQQKAPLLSPVPQTMGECSRKCHNLFVMETVCVAWFSLEFLLRSLQAENKCAFLRTPLNIIDILAILPFYVYWWAVISMTTVGYGDMVPRSVPGQVVALSSILSGILLMAFPVTSIFHTFSRSYSELKEQQQRAASPEPALREDSTRSASATEDSSQDPEGSGETGDSADLAWARTGPA
ncbi:Potassium voltage-gated channel subfamily G member 2 [Myotis brandtii]|uniref:Potassium voltage-gated channel subfamily G member 2 n=1 Tax=Myotis brandtii TaxID=109478 RepID=S7P410_MYOBR|nr:Potassium voltage-gated channel subfamily G member 2 [Myotis brandtii]